MFLSRFGVKNYKCLGEIDIPLTPIHVLIGPNDSGKTSLLEAMAALFASAEQIVSEVFPRPWVGRELVRHGSLTDSVEFVAEWSPEPNAVSAEASSLAYGLSLTFADQSGNVRAGREWSRLNGNEAMWSPPGGSGKTSVRRWNKNSQEPPPLPREHMAAISTVLKPVRKYSLDAKMMALPSAMDPARRFRLDPDGFGLATLLDDILGYDAERFIQLRTEFCRFFPQFRSVRLETTASLSRQFGPTGLYQLSEQTGKAICLETRAGQTIRAQQASDGAVLFLGYLALSYVPEPPKLLLIEEPENGVYPKRLGEIIAVLRATIQHAGTVRLPQIVMSTHSPYVVSLFGPEEVTFLSRPAEDPNAPVRARPLRDAPHIHDRLAGGEFYLGELWYNLTEEELFGDS